MQKPKTVFYLNSKNFLLQKSLQTAQTLKSKPLERTEIIRIYFVTHDVHVFLLGKQIQAFHKVLQLVRRHEPRVLWVQVLLTHNRHY
jgi:hypothetical protein